MKAAALRSHLLGICLGASALIQLVILFFFRFSGGGGDLDKRFLPMTILPYVEMREEPKPEVIKAVEEAEDADEVTEEETRPQQFLKSVSQEASGEPNFLSFVRVDEVAKPKSSLTPDYPDLARNAGIEGTVVLEVYIDEEGRVRKVTVLKSLGFGCDEAAAARVKTVAFAPAMMEGKPVAVRQRITFKFRLN